MQRRRRFRDQRLEIVWAAVDTLDAGLQYELLRELATLHALSAGEPRTGADKVRAAVAALREVADVLGHSPSVKDYRAVRAALPELDLPPESSIRRWLGGGWNICLTRALLDTVSAGDFAARPIGLNDRYEDEEVLTALEECTGELRHPPSATEYFHWARRPDVRERPGRRPSSFRPFERFGGFRSALTAAGVIGETSARYAVNGRALPLRYRYHDDDISSALLTAARRLGRSPRPKEYEEERQRIRGEALRQGEMRALPSMDVIRKRYGSWNEALGKAGLAPVEHPSQPHLGKRHPTYTEEEKLEWIRRAFVQLGEPFTAASYKRWRNQKVEQTDADIPCLATIERTLGGWRSARERALPG